ASSDCSSGTAGTLASRRHPARRAGTPAPRPVQGRGGAPRRSTQVRPGRPGRPPVEPLAPVAQGPLPPPRRGVRAHQRRGGALRGAPAGAPPVGAALVAEGGHRLLDAGPEAAGVLAG